MASPIHLSPKHRRSALEQLSRDRLTALSDHFALDVGDRRIAENHVNAIVRSRSVDFGELLGLLKREELQAICDAVGVDRSGREKEVLIERVIALGGTSEDDPAVPEP